MKNQRRISRACIAIEYTLTDLEAMGYCCDDPAGPPDTLAALLHRAEDQAAGDLAGAAQLLAKFMWGNMEEYAPTIVRQVLALADKGYALHRAETEEEER